MCTEVLIEPDPERTDLMLVKFGEIELACSPEEATHVAFIGCQFLPAIDRLHDELGKIYRRFMKLRRRYRRLRKLARQQRTMKGN